MRPYTFGYIFYKNEFSHKNGGKKIASVFRKITRECEQTKIAFMMVLSKLRFIVYVVQNVYRYINSPLYA